MKKYKTAEGDYLSLVEEYNGSIRLAWYIAEWGMVGSYIGDAKQDRVVDPKNKDDWEVWLADQAVKPFSERLDPDGGFSFVSVAQAKRALAAANQALLSGEAPLPEWAAIAKANGWTPPKGWKP
jgi:hypothetical protein